MSAKLKRVIFKFNILRISGGINFILIRELIMR